MSYTAPTGLSATGTAYNSVILTWTNTESTPDIQIQRKAAGGSYSTLLIIPNEGTVDPQIQLDFGGMVSSNTHYYYRIRYNDGSNVSVWSTEADGWTYPKPPSALSVSSSSVGLTATLEWTNGDTYTYLKVYYKLHADSSWTAYNEALTGTLTTTTVVVPTETADYDFRIRGYNSSTTYNSTYSTTESAWTSGIVAPTGMALTSASTTSIKIDWTDNSSVEDGYEIYMDGALTYTAAADDTTYTKTGLTAATEYTFKVRAKKSTTYSEFCTEASVTTGAVPDANAVIGTVTVVSSTALTPTWTCAATNESGFYIYRSTDDSTYTQIGTADADATSYADTGLDDYTKYYYKVRAYNDYGYSDLSSSANATTSLDLDAPTSLYAESLSSTQIKLSFTVNADSATSHSVERKTSGGSYSAIGSTASGTTATYTDGTCTTDTEYTYRIRAYNSTAGSYGDYSAPITKKILSVGTDSIQKNVTYFSMGNKLYVTSETPQNTITCYWQSKQIDMVELGTGDADRFKTFDKVQLAYTDLYSSVPITVSLSVDGGTTWTSSSATVGTADNTDKVQDFFFAPVTGHDVVVRVSSSDNDTGFSFNGLVIHYDSRGPYMGV